MCQILSYCFKTFSGFLFLAHNNILSNIEFPQCKQTNWFHAVNLCSLPSIGTMRVGGKGGDGLSTTIKR